MIRRCAAGGSAGLVVGDFLRLGGGHRGGKNPEKDARSRFALQSGMSPWSASDHIHTRCDVHVVSCGVGQAPQSEAAAGVWAVRRVGWGGVPAGSEGQGRSPRELKDGTGDGV